MTPHWFSIFATVVLLSVACKGDQDKIQQYETIVVGLGAAGTVAASTLARAGKKVLALEAQDRIGGRVYTVPFGDGVVEVGAEWLHGTEDSRTYQAAVDNNVTLLPQDVHYEIIYSNGAIAGAVINEILETVMNFYDDKPSKPEPLGDYFTRKITDYIKTNMSDIYKDKRLLKQIEVFARQEGANMWGAYDSNDLNAADSYISINGHQTMSWHRHGYKTFFDIMLNKYKDGSGLPSLDIKLKAEVTKIEWPQEAVGKVSVTTKDGSVYKADNVIVTISLGVLKEKYKTLFSPSLSEKKVTAIKTIEMGLVGKTIFSFPNAWWSSKDFIYGLIWDDEDVKKVNAEDQWTTKLQEVSSPMGSSNTLTVWTSGNVTRQIEIMPEDVVKTKIMEVLKRFVGANTTVPEPTGMIRSTWFSNEFTRGTYSYDSMNAVDLPSARSDLAAPEVDVAGNPRVLFAGEASHPTRFATVHGAADTGNREAMRILAK